MWSGLSLGVTPALTALLSPFWGRLADRFGRKIMVERSLVSFVVRHGRDGVRHPGVARLRAARDPGAVRRLRRADADDGGGLGAEGTGWRRRSAPCRRRSASVRRWARCSAASSPRSSACGARSSSRRCSTCGAVVLVFVLYDEQRGARRTPAHGGDDGRERHVSQRARVREFPADDGGHLRPAVRRSELRAGAAAVRRASWARRAARIPLVSGLLFSIAAGAGALGHHYCAALLRRHAPPRLIAAASGGGGVGAGLYVVVHDVRWLFAGDADLRPRDRRRHDRRLYRGGGGDSRRRARRRLRPADDGVARRPRGQPDRQRAAGCHVDPRRVRARRRRARRAGRRGDSDWQGRADGFRTPSRLGCRSDDTPDGASRVVSETL